MKHLLTIAFRNVRANLRPTLAALLSVAMAFFSIFVFDGYIQNVTGLYSNVHRFRLMYGDLIIQNPKLLQKEGKAEPLDFSFSSEQQQRIDTYLSSRSGDVRAAVKNLDFSGTISDGRISTIFVARAFQHDTGLKLRSPDWVWNASYGNPLHVGETEPKILLGQSLASTLGCLPNRIENVVNHLGGFKDGYREFSCDTPDLQLTTTTGTGQVNSLSMIVSGITDAGLRTLDSRYVLADLNDAQTLLNTDRVGYYTILLNESVSAQSFIQEFKTHVTSSDPSIQIGRWQDHPVGESYRRTINMLKIFKNFLIFVLVAICGLSIGMTFSKNVKERTKEIGLLKSLGFNQSKILAIFLLESMLLCCFGIGVGLCAGILTCVLINNQHIYYKAGMISEPVILQIHPHILNMALFAVALTVLGILVCYLTTRSTLKKSPVECLSYT